MNGTRWAARRRGRWPAPWTVAPVALAAAGVLVCLVVAFRPGHQDDGGRTAAPAVTGSPGTAAPGQGSSAGPASPAGTRSPGPSVSPTAAARPSTASARPSAPGTSWTTAATAPLAGRIRPGVGYRGVATTYDAGTGDGACSYGPDDDPMTAAMNHTDYEASKACGAYVLVRAADGATVTVRITDVYGERLTADGIALRPGTAQTTRLQFARH
ncbi:hypothetical protein [Streptomyces sp. NPDC058751]|uniref:hypothetical protein n=1 Tax=Streptomyces sp. NPDC058751 TaxID=3346623 RepID=UPI0036ACB67B